MSGYTKGPWEAETTEATMNDRNEWRIGPRSKPQVVRGVMSTADARLIAAAPELVEALERFVAKHFTPGSKANRPDYVVTVPTADIYALAAVLAKVKGKS